jgi:hypothetical protein
VIGAVALGAVFGGPAIASAATYQPGTSYQPVAARQPAATAGATLTLKADTALPDQKVGFTGGGFRAGEKVTLHWGSAGGTTLATVAASKSGTVPGASTAACETLSAAKSYTVTLDKSVTVGSLQVGEQSGKYGETLAVSAGSSTSVSLTLDHTSLVHANGDLALTSSGSGGDSLAGAGQLQNSASRILEAARGFYKVICR